MIGLLFLLLALFIFVGVVVLYWRYIRKWRIIYQFLIFIFVAMLATGKIPYSLTRHFPIIFDSADRLFEITVEIEIEGKKVKFTKEVFCRHDLSFSAAEMEIRRWEWDSRVINYRTENDEGIIIRLPDAEKKCGKDNKVFSIWRKGGIEKIGWLDKYADPYAIEIYEIDIYIPQGHVGSHEGGHVAPQSAKVSFQPLSDTKSMMSTSTDDYRRNQSWFDDPRGFWPQGPHRKYSGMIAYRIPFDIWQKNTIAKTIFEHVPLSASSNISSHLKDIFDSTENKRNFWKEYYSLTKKTIKSPLRFQKKTNNWKFLTQDVGFTSYYFWSIGVAANKNGETWEVEAKKNNENVKKDPSWIIEFSDTIDIKINKNNTFQGKWYLYNAVTNEIVLLTKEPLKLPLIQ